MMRHTRSAALLLSLGSIAGIQAFGQTAPAIQVSDGTNTVVISSQGTKCTGTCSTGAPTISGGVTTWNGTVGNFSITNLMGQTTSPPPALDLGSTKVINNGSTQGTLTMTWSNTGFDESGGQLVMSSNTTVLGGTVSAVYNAYIDNSNTLFAETTKVGTITGVGVQSYTGSGPTVYPFSMTMVVALTVAPASGASFDDTVAGSPTNVSLSCMSATTGTIGTPYSSALVALGGIPPYSFTITSGALGDGLSLNGSTGLISGTPTASGTLSFTAQVTDSSGNTASNTASASCSIGIPSGGNQNPPTPPKVTCPSSTATVGVAYSSSVGVTGGSGSYTFKIVYGSLPAGLTLNTSSGLISGIPTQAGQTGAFKIQVTDNVTGAVAYTNCSGSCSNGTTVTWGGSGNPQSGWGQKSWTDTYNSNNVQLTVYGWDVWGNHANLYANNYGGNSYLGISNDQWGQNQIDTNHFVQCDFSNAINAGATGGSVTVTGTGWGGSFDIYGSNTLGQLGTLLQGNVQANTWSQGGQSVTVPQFGKYKYICVKAHQGSSCGVSICNISTTYPCACSIDVNQASNQGGWGGNGGGSQGGNGGGSQGGNGGNGGGQGSGNGQCGW